MFEALTADRCASSSPLDRSAISRPPRRFATRYARRTIHFTGCVDLTAAITVLGEEGWPPDSIYGFVQGITAVARDRLCHHREQSSVK